MIMRKYHLPDLKLLLVTMLIIGILFRFYNLDRKFYWKDETYSSLRISGYTSTELIHQVFDGRQVSVKDLQMYQHINPEKSSFDTIKALASAPEHPPLYYLLARFWEQCLGDSVLVIRSLSAIISLLTFPCLYMLCRELFGISTVGTVAMSFIAISPFHVLYAQEAREYSLWIVTILLSSAMLLQAVRLKTRLSWKIYAATAALGLYSHLFFVFVSISHGIYIIISERFRQIKVSTSYLFASCASIIAFLPWIVISFTEWSKASSQHLLNVKTDLFFDKKSFINMLLLNVSRCFFDLSPDPFSSFWRSSYCLSLFFLALAIYSLYFVIRNASNQTSLFILTLFIVPVILLVLCDLTTCNQRSDVFRYLIPSYLAIQLAVSYTISCQIENEYIGFKKHNFWILVMLALAFGGIFSCSVSSQAIIWWNKSSEQYIPQIARFINHAHHPLLASTNDRDTAIGILSLSHLLNSTVQYQAIVEPNQLSLVNRPENETFMYLPSKELRAFLGKEVNCQVEPVNQLGKFRDKLWHIKCL